MTGYTIIAYRKICESDRSAIAAGHLLPRRFELHTNLSEQDARSLFTTYGDSPQVLAVEVYGPGGLLDRRDLLLDLVAREASDAQFAAAVQSPL
jgi:hypothetical protein